jgi:glycosyltransferase involved in cell wall biosynthesis
MTGNATMKTPFFSVVICSIDPWRFAQVYILYEQLLAGFPHEIIGIHDAKSLAEGYNRGLARARGDILIFSHDDILILDPDFARKIGERLRDFDILGFAGTQRLESEYWWNTELSWMFGAMAHHIRNDRYISLSIWNTKGWPVIGNIQAIDGLCIVARREIVEEIGFDETVFDGFHLYDLDFSFSAWRAGKKVGVCCDIPILHASMGKYDANHSRYGRLFIEKHKDALPDSRPEPRPGGIQGAGILLSSPQALRMVWQEDIFRRALTSWQRRQGDAEQR